MFAVLGWIVLGGWIEVITVSALAAIAPHNSATFGILPGCHWRIIESRWSNGFRVERGQGAAVFCARHSAPQRIE